MYRKLRSTWSRVSSASRLSRRRQVTPSIDSVLRSLLIHGVLTPEHLGAIHKTSPESMLRVLGEAARLAEPLVRTLGDGAVTGPLAQCYLATAAGRQRVRLHSRPGVPQHDPGIPRRPHTVYTVSFLRGRSSRFPDVMLVPVPLGAQVAKMITGFATQAITSGKAVIVIDGKREPELRQETSSAAQRAGRSFVEVAPDQPGPYAVPWERLGAQMIAEMLMPERRFRDDYRCRRAHLCVVQVVRFLRMAELEIDLRRIVAYLDEGALSRLILKSEDGREELERFLDSLQPGELSSCSEYLEVLADCDLRHWLGSPAPQTPSLDLVAAINTRSVVYFDLSFRNSHLFSPTVADAVAFDLIRATEDLPGKKAPALVVVIGPTGISTGLLETLASRGRMTGISVIGDPLGFPSICDPTVSDHAWLQMMTAHRH